MADDKTVTVQAGYVSPDYVRDVLAKNKELSAELATLRDAAWPLLDVLEAARFYIETENPPNDQFKHNAANALRVSLADPRLARLKESPGGAGNVAQSVIDNALWLEADKKICELRADLAAARAERDAVGAVANDAIDLAIKRRDGCPHPDGCFACERQRFETDDLRARLSALGKPASERIDAEEVRLMRAATACSDALLRCIAEFPEQPAIWSEHWQHASESLDALRRHRERTRAESGGEG